MRIFPKSIAILLVLLLIVPNMALGYITTDNQTKAFEFIESIGHSQFAENPSENVTLGEYFKVLFNSTGLVPTESNYSFKFNDVPGEFEVYAEKARQLGLVYYNPQNPVFGYNTEIGVNKALELGLKFYGLNSSRYILNSDKFKQDITNFSPSFISAPMIERAYMLGLIKPVNGKVSFYEKITKGEVANLLFSLKTAQERALNTLFVPTNTTTIPSNSTNSPKIQDIPAPKTTPKTTVKTTKVSPKSTTNSNLAKNEKFRIFEDVYRRITQEYYQQDKVDADELFYGAITGLVDKLDDSYTTFQEPDSQNSVKQTLSNQIEGIGASLGLNDKKQIIVISPLSDSPAQKAGLRAGDIILKIDGKELTNLGLSQAVSLIQGKAGTTVKLSIQRGTATQEISIKRAAITVPTVTAEITADNIGVVKIRNFGLGIEDTFASYASQLKKAKVKGIVLDLRNNPGGYLDSATAIAGHFMDSGKLVSKVKYLGNEYTDNETSGPSDLKGIPLRVVVNSGSASAAEILAAALKDQAGAKLVGEKTFGKGTVQELITYSDNSTLKITIAHWLTPKGVDVNKVGISPELKVSISENDLRLGNDPQLNRAISDLK
jgi:carboxyl-terminal processing protease